MTKKKYTSNLNLTNIIKSCFCVLFVFIRIKFVAKWPFVLRGASDVPGSVKAAAYPGPRLREGSHAKGSGASVFHIRSLRTGRCPWTGASTAISQRNTDKYSLPRITTVV